jgi:hypothetical protein
MHLFFFIFKFWGCKVFGKKKRSFVLILYSLITIGVYTAQFTAQNSTKTHESNILQVN